ncbi:uncharacterized protein LOC127798724 [Diospyros lotus]|uniref:uncharacterized protein LOC127798724 n=1 Tax=Diospyros lotus TaxID=55363 RepID=UPI0022595BE6|nr:uncharacterized protein LOC127798724 [Diospyros lotus]
MSAIAAQNLLANPYSRLSSFSPNTHFPSRTFFPSLSSTRFSNLPQFRTPSSNSSNPVNFDSVAARHWAVGAFPPDGSFRRAGGAANLNLDAFLSVVEFLCLAPSAAISIGFAVNSSFQRPVFTWLGNRFLVWQWQFVLLAAAVAVGASIRRRQWSRICANARKTEDPVAVLVGRIEKLEDDLRSSATIIRVMLRQIEKLGIRFRVTRKALKEPISEAAALAQKNSEATRALVLQEEILEKELSEIQKVLLAMQDQQQKQVDLILAIGKIGKVWDRKRGPSQRQEAIETCNSAEAGQKQLEISQIQSLTTQKEAKTESP